jgi:hypothetical protein
MQNRKVVNQLVRGLAAIATALILLCVLLETMRSSEKIKAQPSFTGDNSVFLPLVYHLTPLVGTYDCYEYEFGLIWTTEVVTLNKDGSSLYVYSPPYAAIITGTWVYTPVIQEVGFTNFRWPTATFQLPDRLWASNYITPAGYEVALSCGKR